jgi:hypothetical protein
MTDGPEAGLPPRGHEEVDPPPAVKGGAKPVGLEHTIDFPQGDENQSALWSFTRKGPPRDLRFTGESEAVGSR